MANGYRWVHDLNDPRCMIEEAMGWEHSSQHDGEIQMTPEQQKVWDRASDLYGDICYNHNQGTPARNKAERRIYADLDLDAADREIDARLAESEARAEQVYAYNHGNLQAVSSSWLETEDGREFLAECREAEQAEFAADGGNVAEFVQQRQHTAELNADREAEPLRGSADWPGGPAVADAGAEREASALDRIARARQQDLAAEREDPGLDGRDCM